MRASVNNVLTESIRTRIGPLRASYYAEYTVTLAATFEVTKSTTACSFHFLNHNRVLKQTNKGKMKK